MFSSFKLLLIGKLGCKFIFKVTSIGSEFDDHFTLYSVWCMPMSAVNDKICYTQFIPKSLTIEITLKNNYQKRWKFGIATVLHQIHPIGLEPRVNKAPPEVE
jgi:hypothetical protein